MLSLQDDDDIDSGDDNDATIITIEHEIDAGDEDDNEGEDGDHCFEGVACATANPGDARVKVGSDRQAATSPGRPNDVLARSAIQQ